QPAGLDRPVHGVGPGQGQGPGPALGRSAVAGDGPGEGPVARLVEDQAGVVDDVADERGGIADQGPVAHLDAAGVAVGSGEDQGSEVGLDQLASAGQGRGDGGGVVGPCGRAVADADDALGCGQFDAVALDD